MKNFKSIVVSFTVLLISFCNQNIASKESNNNTPENEISISLLKDKVSIAKKYCQSKKLNTDYFFIIDLKQHSGLKRFYIWDFKKDTVVNSFLVSHGCAQNPWGQDASKENAATSNQDGSHASSIGKYIIGKKGYSNWGIHVNYLLHGKDSSNTNALQRQIVLHSWEEVSDKETYPYGTPEGWGCPAVSNSSMYLLDEMLTKSKKRVLLWIIK